MVAILPERRNQVVRKDGSAAPEMACGRPSAAGSVSQRACVFCGSRVVLYPIADALHLVHGPIGCAVYTWDIRGALSSGPELHRNSFSTDLQERDVIHGGEKKLYRCLIELIRHYQPSAAFVYSTCIVGIIGDDVGAVCRRVAGEQGLPVIPVHSEGFKGTKKDGYRAACDALMKIIRPAAEADRAAGNTAPLPRSINLLGEFNIAGETWIMREYFKRIGVEIIATLTGDGRIADIRRSHRAALNLVQCSGSMTHLAKQMQEEYGIPFKRISCFGIEDMSQALYDTADFFEDPEMTAKARDLVRAELSELLPALQNYRRRLEGRHAAIYVGGAFKAFSLVRALRMLGMKTVLVGSQTGNPDDYRQLQALCDEGTVIVDDTNPLELSGFLKEQKVDLLIGGVKERPIAHKMGVGFCDHNHERKIPLAGFIGMLNFAREVEASVNSPVWQFMPGHRQVSLNGGRP